VTDRSIIAQASVPCLAAHMRLRFDKARDLWTIQAPERAFVLDEIAQAIVSRCNGKASVEAIIKDLCDAFRDAPHDVIEKDVLVLLQNFADKGVLSA
jgi:pyrroloquinoline quinone biosynthesis protein D